MRRIRIAASQRVILTNVIEMTDKDFEILSQTYHRESYSKLQKYIEKYLDTRAHIVDWDNLTHISIVDDVTGEMISGD